MDTASLVTPAVVVAADDDDLRSQATKIVSELGIIPKLIGMSDVLWSANPRCEVVVLQVDGGLDRYDEIGARVSEAWGAAGLLIITLVRRALVDENRARGRWQLDKRDVLSLVVVSDDPEALVTLAMFIRRTCAANSRSGGECPP